MYVVLDGLALSHPCSPLTQLSPIPSSVSVFVQALSTSLWTDAIVSYLVSLLLLRYPTPNPDQSIHFIASRVILQGQLT